MFNTNRFTNTIYAVATQLLSNSISKTLNIKNFMTITFNGNYSNDTVGHHQEWLPWQKDVKNISTKYIKSVSIDYEGIFDDASVIRINSYRHSYQYFYCTINEIFPGNPKRVTFNISDDNSLNLIKSTSDSIKVSVGAQDICGGGIGLYNVDFSITIYFE